MAERRGTGALSLAHRIALAAGTVLASPVAAIAQDAGEGGAAGLARYLPVDSLSDNTIMFPIFMGAFAFAMWSATWLIRARRRLETEFRTLQNQHADLRARHERAQVLINLPDQRTVVWTTRDEPPMSRGTLPEASGAPQEDAEFIRFGGWMAPHSAQSFQHAVERLREKAEAFDLTVESRSGAMIDVQGRASGSHAFVRFHYLEGERAALASLEQQHTGLMEKTDTMQALLQALPFPVWLRDAAGRLGWANDAYVAAVDASDLEAAQDADLQLLDSSAREKMAKSHAAHGGEGIADARDYARLRLPVTIAGNRNIADVSEIRYGGSSAGMAVDVSEVEDVQARLRRTLESHAQTLNELATAIAIFNEKRRLVFHNQAFETLWGLDPSVLEEEPDNGALFDRLRDTGKVAEQPDWSKWRNNLLGIYQATQPAEDIWHLPDRRTLRVVATPHAQGGATWAFEDITDQLDLQSRFTALTRVQGETLDHLAEAIAVFAPDGKLKLSNPSFQQLWALEDETVAANRPVAAIAKAAQALTDEPEVWEKLTTGITGVSDERRAISGRMSMRAGTIVDYALVPLPNGQSMLSFADVTANVQLEQTLTERNEALRAAERLKNDFIEHVSYEFRAPLTNIMGFAELLATESVGPLNGRQREYVGHIATSSNVLHALVDNLLDLATVDAGFMRLESRELAAAEIVDHAMESVGDAAKEQGVTLEAQLPENATALNFIADPVRVQQVLFNLLHNAIKFSPDGSKVQLELRDRATHIAFLVRDNGPGIAPEDRQAVFERFRASAASSGHRGAGLGLSIARSLVELHGGTIVLLDEGGEATAGQRGACFECRFPKAPPPQGDAASQAAE